jgi:hypothetical protein
MNEIQKYYDEKADQMHISETPKSNMNQSDEIKSDFKTISIDY